MALTFIAQFNGQQQQHIAINRSITTTKMGKSEVFQVNLDHINGNVTLLHVDKKGADQPVHQCSLNDTNHFIFFIWKVW